MIKVDNVETWGFEHAVRGMRNPLNSWHKSDSGYGCRHNNQDSILCRNCEYTDCCDSGGGEFIVGTDDLFLMHKLCAAGTEHRKFLRQIFVSMDVVAPLYWWKEYDTYKVGTVANSCSTMHTIHKKEFELDDFSTDHLEDFSWNRLDDLIGHLNICREKYLLTSDKGYWWQIIQLLPQSYNQRRTLTMNYENVLTIISQRNGHKLDEWKSFVGELKNLPHVREIMEGVNENG